MTQFKAHGVRNALLPQHQKMLCDAGITQEVIDHRGYESITCREELTSIGFDWKQASVPGLLIPIRHVNEMVLKNNPTITYLQYRPDNPRTDGEGRPVKYEIAKGDSLCIDVPPASRPLLSDYTLPLWITEGAKKADAAASHDLCCINLMGVWGWRRKSEEGTESRPLDDWKYINLRHRRVYIAFDSDVTQKPAVKQAMNQLRHFLQSQGAIVKTIYLPAENDKKVGLDDYFGAGGTVEKLITLTRRNPSNGGPGDIDEDLPIVKTHNRQVRETVDEVTKALVEANDPPTIFVSSGHLTRLRLIETDQGEIAKLDPMSKDALTDRLSRVANFVSVSQRGLTSVNPPDVVVRLIMAQAEWPGVPSINGVVTSPVFSADGVLCDEPGYNAAAHIYYHSREPLHLPDTTPNSPNVEAAMRLFYDELFVDFPFADKASRAHALAMTLLPFVRSMITDSTPMHLFDAPRAGTGKSLLASLIANVFVPHGVAVRAAPKDESEWRKQLTSFFREGNSHMLLDNVRELNSEALQAALTAPDGLWTDRLLGGNEEGKFPIRCTWATTCNNITGTREQLRRCIWIRLDAKTERPEERTDFKHLDIRGWLRQNRAQVVGAAVTLIRAWIEAGRPNYSGRGVMGSFDSWVRVIGGILENASEMNFLGNQREFAQGADSEAATLTPFIQDWWAIYTNKWVGAGQLLGVAVHYYADELGNNGERSQAVRLGKILGKHRDWVVGDKILSARPSKNGLQYRLDWATSLEKGVVQGG